MATESTFVTARTVDEAVAYLAADDEAVAVSGGTSIGLLTGQGLIRPSAFVWLGRVPDLGTVAVDDSAVTIGAAVTLMDLARHGPIRRLFPALAEAAGVVGNPRVRAVATLGGALAHGDPRQDVPPALLALGATVVVTGPEGHREIPLSSFYTGFMECDLEQGELITAVVLPVVDRRRSVYLRFTPGSAADYPTVGAAAVLDVGGERRSPVATVALAGVAPTPLLLPPHLGRPDPEAVGRAAAAAARPTGDRLGSAAYKQAMAAVWAGRAIDELLAREPAI